MVAVQPEPRAKRTVPRSTSKVPVVADVKFVKVKEPAALNLRPAAPVTLSGTRSLYAVSVAISSMAGVELSTVV